MNLKMAISQLKTIRRGIQYKDDKRNMGIIIRYLETLEEEELSETERRTQEYDDARN